MSEKSWQERLDFLKDLRDMGATRVRDVDGFEVEFGTAPPPVLKPLTLADLEQLPDFEPPEEVNDPDEDMRTLALYSAR